MGVLYLFFIKLVSRLPFWFLYRISDLLAFILYYTGVYRKNVVLENLKLAFPNKTEKERKKICRKFFIHFTDIMVESLKYFTLSEKKMKKRLTIKNNDIIINNKNNNIFLLTGHYGNWESCSGYGIYINRNKTNFYALYKPLSNKKLNVELKKSRERFGVKLIPLGGATKKILNKSKSIKQNIYGIITDQSPQKKGINRFMTFLGLETGVSTHLEFIGKRIGADYFSTRIKKIKRGFYELEFKNINTNDDKDVGVIEIFYKELEKQIIEKPEYWLWTHRRWKHKKEDINL